MRRLNPRTYEEQIDYHLVDGRAPIFSQTQAGRVELARFLIDKILSKDLLLQRPLRFIELGCGAGDVTGPYSKGRWLYQTASDPDQPPWRGHSQGDPEMLIDREIEVIGVDVTPMAIKTIGERFPLMKAVQSPVEELEPMECDLLVMTEFLEHVADPVKIVHDWLPLAKWAVIGHPLNEPEPAFEPGHIWSYALEDWNFWFNLGGHHIWERFMFPMGPWEAMIMGHSCRNDQLAF